MTIIGVSFDDPDNNDEWRDEEEFEFELWSDLDRELALIYGAADSSSEFYASRVNVILDAETNFIVFYPTVNTATGPQDVLDDCTILFGE